jgi:hypothetical protein
MQDDNGDGGDEFDMQAAAEQPVQPPQPEPVRAPEPEKKATAPAEDANSALDRMRRRRRAEGNR